VMRMRWMGAASASSTPGFCTGLIAVAICTPAVGIGENAQRAGRAQWSEPLTAFNREAPARRCFQAV
jgi:hypothetical protein